MNHDELRKPASGNQPLPAESDPLWQTLDDWQVSAPTPDFDANIMARIQREEAESAPKSASGAKGWLDSWRWILTGRAWALSGALAAVLFAVVLLRQPVQTPTGPVTTETETAMDVSAQQVEWALEDLEMLEELYGPEDGQSNLL